MIAPLINRLQSAFSELFPASELDVVQCSRPGIAEAMSFIEKHWKHGHIMAHDIDLVDFMHFDTDSQCYNFMIGKGKHDGNMVGLLGYIPTSKYDPDLLKDGDAWLAIWKSIGLAGFGLQLLAPIASRYNTIAAIGINGHVAKVYKWLGFNITRLKQLFLLNRSLQTFSIAMADQRYVANPSSDGVRLHSLTEDELLNIQLPVIWRPRKTSRYIINRYLKHPIYSYKVWCVLNNGTINTNCVFVTRKIHVGTSSCLRLVDIVGNLDSIPVLNNAWQELLEEENSEYLDCMEFGLSENEEKILGLNTLNPNGNTIVPNYFEPFVRENISITAAVMNPTNTRYVMFKGDSDQDRPSERNRT